FSATDLVIATQTSHSGGTDKDGCHTDSKTGERHCHEKEGDKKE
ncbi:MAG: YHYH domain-containing protein, partial [Panacagrimonas sp.]